MNEFSSAASTGFFTSIALIFAIGAQNAYVLKNGIIRNHVFWVCLTCSLSDAILIVVGITGFGIAAAHMPILPVIMRYAGAAFLIFYGLSRFIEAYRGNAIQQLSNGASSLSKTLATCLALTWLNPHVYLDTIGLIGGVSTQYEQYAGKVAFGIGAISASFLFFFSLGYFSRFLGPIMQTNLAWRVLDTLIGILMLYLAANLLLH